MKRRRFYLFTAGFALSSLLMCYVFAPAAVYFAAAAAALCALALVLRAVKKVPHAVPVCLGLLAGAVFFLVYDALHSARAEALIESPGRYEAEVVAYPAEGGVSVLVRVKTPEGRGVKLSLSLPLPEAAQGLAPGDKIAGEMRFYRNSASAGFDYDTYYKARGVFLRGYAKEVAVEKAGGSALRHWPELFSRAAKEKSGQIFKDSAPLLNALVFGDTSGFDDGFRFSVNDTGVAHVFAVSGMHLSVLVSAVLLLGRRRRAAAAAAVPVVLAFMAVTGFSPSVVRAGVMQIMMLAACVANREGETWSALCASLLINLLANPWSAADARLQLSYASVLGLLTVGARLGAWLDGRIKTKGRAATGVKKALVPLAAATVSAQAATAPLVMAYFGRVSLIATLTNMLCLWAVSVTFVLALCALLISFVWMGLARAAALPVRLGAWYLAAVVKWLAGVPFAAFGTGGAALRLAVAGAYLIWVPAFFLRAKKAAGRCAVVIAALLASALAMDFYAEKSSFIVDVLDVGSGQCIIATCRGSAAVVDCASGRRAAEELRRRNIRRIDVLFLTHAHSDHAGGAPLLLSLFDVGLLAMPRFPEGGALYEEILAAARENGVPVSLFTADENYELAGGLALRAFAAPGKGGENEFSAAALIESGGASVLVLGDMDDTADARMARTRDIPDTSALVAGHHGAKNATSAEILEKSSPEYVIISVGKNSYGHPAEETAERIVSFGAKLWRTDLHGPARLIFKKGRAYAG